MANNVCNILKQVVARITSIIVAVVALSKEMTMLQLLFYWIACANRKC